MRRNVVLSVLVITAACSANPEPSLRSSGTRERAISIGTDTPNEGFYGSTPADAERVAVTAVNASPDQVWQVLPDVYQELGIPLGTNESASRMLGNRNLVVTRGKLVGQSMSSYLNCGMAELGGFAANEYRVNLSVMSAVKPGAGGTGSQVQTLVEATAADHRAPQGRAARPCTSTGEIERQIAARVRARLGV
jgi:hypothetical protein